LQPAKQTKQTKETKPRNSNFSEKGKGVKEKKKW